MSYSCHIPVIGSATTASCLVLHDNSSRTGGRLSVSLLNLASAAGSALVSGPTSIDAGRSNTVAWSSIMTATRVIAADQHAGDGGSIMAMTFGRGAVTTVGKGDEAGREDQHQQRRQRWAEQFPGHAARAPHPRFGPVASAPGRSRPSRRTRRGPSGRCRTPPGSLRTTRARRHAPSRTPRRRRRRCRRARCGCWRGRRSARHAPCLTPRCRPRAATRFTRNET